MTWTPVRFLSATALSHCDAVITGDAPRNIPPAIWSLYRFAGLRLAELDWDEALCAVDHGE